MAQVQIYDSVHDPDRDAIAPVLYQTIGATTWYRVYVYLTGPDAPFVTRARYYFPNIFNPTTVDTTAGSQNRWSKIYVNTPMVGFEVVADVWFRYLPQPQRFFHTMRYQHDLQGLPPQQLIPSGSLAP